MKRFILLILLFGIVDLGAKEVSKWSIADIYGMAQQATVFNLHYPIYHQMLKEEKWVSITTAWNTFIDATVDKKTTISIFSMREQVEEASQRKPSCGGMISEIFC